MISLSKLETVLAQTVGSYLNGEPQTPSLSYISNAKLLSFRLLLSAVQNTSKKWLCNLVFNEDCNISPMIFYSQPQVEHKLGEIKNCYAK